MPNKNIFILDGRNSVVLNDPEILYQVQSGQVYVFAVPTQPDMISPRRHLFTCAAGEIFM